MATSQVSIQNSLSSGEISPAIWGRSDLEKYHNGTSTCRNFFSNYRGGVMSRAGLAYVGTSLQTFPEAAPRLIPFQFSLTQGYVLEFGQNYMRIVTDGAFVTEDPQSITGISNANPAVMTYASNGSPPYTLHNGDWIYVSGCNGLDYFNDLIVVVSSLSGANFIPLDMFGNPFDTTTMNPYTTPDGNLERIATFTSPYAASDLPFLKFVQSADVMTLTCVNTETGTEYPPYSLTRLGNTDWVFAVYDFGSSVPAPTNLVVSANSSTTPDTWYSYVVTAVSGDQESIASISSAVENNDISLFAGSNSLAWDQVPGAQSYNIYATTPSYAVPPPASSLYGFIGTALAPGFTDTNLISDFTKTPPIHSDPFAQAPISDIVITNPGSGYSQATVGYVITGGGTGFIGTPIVESGSVVGFIIQNPGFNYSGSTIAFTGGTGATADIVVGPSTGTYPAVSAYYQQRQVYASTTNQPDTYWMSQPGLYNNFDASIPIIDSDAIEGTPWAQQVNGIQWLVPMPGGLVVLTGKGAWQVNGGSLGAITPSDQTATPQAYNGANGTVPPITINYDIIYLQSKGSAWRDLSYNFFVNIYTGTDLTVLSDHLVRNFQMIQAAWSEEPYRLLWVVRNDGQMLCLTYVKEQDVYAWTRHDTNGGFLSVASVTEPPVDAVYVVTIRYIQGNWRYYIERMNNRLWTDVENAFCVDAGLTTANNFVYPQATITPDSNNSSSTTVTATSAVFSPTYVGQVMRVGGGSGLITAYGNNENVTVDFSVVPVTETAPNDPNNRPLPQSGGNWSIAPVYTTIEKLNHLEGMTVAILSDGSVVENQVVTNGMVTLPAPASLVTVGLPYTCQVQTLYLDHPQEKGDTTQNRRKNISALGIRVYASRGIQVGADQIDQSTLENFPQVTWNNMIEVTDRTPQNYAGQPVPLYTGDYYLAITSGWDLKGQVAIQQTYPLPAQILAVVPYWIEGDDKG